jgi:hypothetical protein
MYSPCAVLTAAVIAETFSGVGAAPFCVALLSVAVEAAAVLLALKTIKSVLTRPVFPRATEKD